MVSISKGIIHLITGVFVMATPLVFSDSPKVCLDPLVKGRCASTTLKAQKVVSERRHQGLEVFNWGLGENPFPIPELIVQAVKEHAADAPYTPVDGIPGLSQAIADVYNEGREHTVRAEDVVVGNGLKQLLFDMQRAFGGKIIHVIPYWVSYGEQTRLLGKEAVELRTKEQNAYKLQPEELERVCQEYRDTPKMLLFNNPINPTGGTYTEEELKALAEVLRKHDVIVIADEVYWGNHHNGKHASLFQYLPERTIRAASMSKEFAAGGYRLGWAVFPTELFEMKRAVSVIGTSTYSCAPVPQQFGALAAFMNYGSFEDYRKNTQYIFKHLTNACRERFSKIGIMSPEPSAAWYLFLDFEKHRETLAKKGVSNSAQLVETLLREVGIVFIPGSAFGMPEDSLTVRASVVDFDGENALKSLNINPKDAPSKEQVAAWGKHLFQGIDALAVWLQKESI